jgi:hypothetical protein
MHGQRSRRDRSRRGRGSRRDRRDRRGHGSRRDRRGPATTGREQRQAAQRDARHNRRAARELPGAERVTEHDHASDRADQWLEVEERPGDLGGHPALPEGEQRERQQRAAGRQRDDGQDRTWPRRDDGHALGDRGDGHRGERGGQELHGGHRDRVTAGQQPCLRDGDRGRDEQRGQHQPVAGQRGTAASAAGDEADADQRHRETNPGHRPGHGAVP